MTEIDPVRVKEIQERLNIVRYKLESDGFYVGANTLHLAQELIFELTGVNYVAVPDI